MHPQSPQPDPVWDLTRRPTAALLDLLHDYGQAHAATLDKEYQSPAKEHLAVHWYNLRWAVARELERRGINPEGILPLQQPLGKAISAGAVALLRKAVTLGSNERWITVHPHGDSEPGVPVLITQHPDGTASVIGGAGGALNYVKLSNVKSPEEYAQQKQGRAAEKRAQAKLDMAGLSQEEKQDRREQQKTAREGAKAAKQQAKIEKINTVYQAMGQEAPVFKPVEELAKENGVELAAAKIARAREIEAHLKAANLVESLVKEAVLNDHETAAAAGLGEISLGTSSDTDLWGEGKVGLDSLVGKPPSEAAGVKSDFKAKAQGAGAGAGEVKEEGKLVRERRHAQMSGEGEAAAHRMIESMARWNEEAQSLEEAGVVKQGLLKPQALPDAGKMMAILRAGEQLRQASRKADARAREAEKGNTPGAPMVVDTEEAVDAGVVKAFRQEAEVRVARALLNRVGNEVGLTRHVRTGAFDALNEAGLTITNAEVLDRNVVEALGVPGAARVLACRLRQRLSDEEYGDVREAVQNLHAATNTDRAKEAVEQADALLEKAKAIELSTVETPVDIVAARTLNDERMGHVEKARQILGDTYGRLTALGHLGAALGEMEKGPQGFTVDLGDTPRAQAITMARSFGMVPETSDVADEDVDAGKIGAAGAPDYRIEAGAGKTVMHLNADAWQKVTNDFQPAEMVAYHQAQSIKAGTQDEEGWLPAGIERRPGSTFTDPTYNLARFSHTFNLNEGSSKEDLRTQMEDLVGAQMGEGYDYDQLADDVYSPEFTSAHIPAALHGDYDKLLQEMFPIAKLTDAELGFRKETGKEGFLKGKAGVGTVEAGKVLAERQQQLREESLTRARALSEQYKKRHGMTDEDLVALHSQRLPVDQAPENTTEAIHRTLSAMPHAASAFVPLGQFAPADKDNLRTFYLRQVAGIEPREEEEEKPQGPARKENPTAQQGGFGFGDEDEEPAYEFKDVTQGPDFRSWLEAKGKSAQELTPDEHAELESQFQQEQQAKPRSKDQEAWGSYVRAMGGQQQAYRTIQSLLKGQAVEEYAKNHARIFGKPLKVGKEKLPGWDRHLLARLPQEKLEEALGSRASEARQLLATVARRVGGKFAKEEEGARLEAMQKLKAMFKGKQFSLFMAQNFPTVERPTLGHDAENQLGSVWGHVAENFSGGKGGVKLIQDLSMSGDKVKQQRAVKLATKLRRFGLHLGAGSGKSLVSIGAFTQLHSEGKAKKAVYVVPSAVLGQFGSEMLRFTKPGAYRWLADPSASREERMAAYADDTTHMVVCTHQAFRDDLAHAVGQHLGVKPGEVGAKLKGMPVEERRRVVKEATDKLGWKTDFGAVDEAHNIVNRAGKPDSSMSTLMDAYTYHLPSYVSMTGTPVKNDASEAFDTLAKLHPQRFTDRAAFMRRYGGNAPACKASLQRLTARYTYADKVSSGVNRNVEVRTVDLTPKQQEAYNALDKALGRVRATRRGGQVDVAAVQAIAPEAFAKAPEEQHQEIANQLAAKGLGGRLQHRRNEIVNGFDYEHNAKINALRDDLKRDGGKPTVIFAHNYASIEAIKRLCKEEGLKFGVVSGKMSAGEKAKARLKFQPDREGQEPTHDVLINTDAGSTGQNLQRGSVIVNYDTPDTAMTHEQRIARIDRLGQTQDVTVRDYTTNTPHERKARRRLDTKYALADVFQSPSELADETGLAAEIQAVRAARRDRRMAA